MPAYQSRPPRQAERHDERQAERSTPRAKPAVRRDALFDTPYVPSDAAGADSTPALVRPTSKKQVAALFRSPAKPDSAGQ